MTSNQEHRSDRGRIVFGILLTLLLCFIAVSLFSYSPLDPPGSLVHSPGSAPIIHNAAGPAGASCASLLVRFCGFGAWFLLIPLLLRLVSYWTKRELTSPILKTVGVAMTLAAFSGGVSTFLPAFLGADFSDSGGRAATWAISLQSVLTDRIPLCGPGGWLGASIRFLLENGLHLAPLGILLFLVSAFTAGMILACEWSFLRLILLVTGILPLAEILLSFQGKGHRVPRQKRPVTDEKGMEKKGEPTDTAPEEETTSDDDLDETPEPQDADVRLDETEDTESDTEGLSPPPEERDSSKSILRKSALDRKQAISPDEKPSGTSVREANGASDSEPPKPRRYTLPPIEILEENPPVEAEWSAERIGEQVKRLEKAFANFNCQVRVRDYQSGPVITLFELDLAKGLRLSSIQGLAPDLALAMKVPSVRIVAPIPGKNTVGVEIPNKDRLLVRLREVMTDGNEEAKKMVIPLFIGKDVAGEPLLSDLAKLPHLLIAGRTGTGKSVCLNSIILSILMTRTPDEIRLILIDPKMVELSPYKTVPHLMHPVITDMKKAAAIFGWAVEKMEERYELFARAGVRQLKEYNQLTPERLRRRIQPESDEEWEKIPKKLPSLVIIADEVADMMAVAGKEVPELIARIAQKSRAVGFYLILATQKPTVDVVTSLIKSNLPARIAFGVATQSDSRVILDVNGAEQLLGNGDLLFLDSVTNQIIRGQGTYVSGEEINSVICEISVDTPDFVKIDFDDDLLEGNLTGEIRRSDDPLYNAAVELVLSEGRGSTSLLQRRFSIGYGRAAKIIDAMEAAGILGPKTENDSKPRKILISHEEWETMKESDTDAPVKTPDFPSLAPEYRKLPSQQDRSGYSYEDDGSKPVHSWILTEEEDETDDPAETDWEELDLSQGDADTGEEEDERENTGDFDEADDTEWDESSPEETDDMDEEEIEEEREETEGDDDPEDVANNGDELIGETDGLWSNQAEETDEALEGDAEEADGSDTAFEMEPGAPPWEESPSSDSAFLPKTHAVPVSESERSRPNLREMAERRRLKKKNKRRNKKKHR